MNKPTLEMIRKDYGNLINNERSGFRKCYNSKHCWSANFTKFLNARSTGKMRELSNGKIQEKVNYYCESAEKYTEDFAGIFSGNFGDEQACTAYARYSWLAMCDTLEKIYKLLGKEVKIDSNQSDIELPKGMKPISKEEYRTEINRTLDGVKKGEKSLDKACAELNKAFFNRLLTCESLAEANNALGEYLFLEKEIHDNINVDKVEQDNAKQDKVELNQGGKKPEHELPVEIEL